MKNKLNLYQVFCLLRNFLIATRISVPVFLLALALAFFASLFEGLSLSLLIPLIHGMIHNDFSFVSDLPVLHEIVSRFPSHFPFGNRNFVILLLVLTFFISVLKIICQYFSSLTLSRLLRRFASELRQLVFQRYMSFGKLFFDKSNQGELHQIITNYVGSIAAALQSFHSGLYALCTLFVYVVIMFSISWKLSLLVLTIFPVLHLSLHSLIARITKTSRHYAESFNDLGRKISNTLTTIPLIQAYRYEQEEIATFRHLSQTVENAERSLDKKNLLISPLQELISLCFLFLLVGIICFLISLDKQWNIAGYMVFLVILRRSAVMFGVFNNMRNSLAMVSGPMEYVRDIFEDDGKFSVKNGENDTIPRGEEITFNELTYSYPDCKAALTNVQFVMKPGEITALVGESGAGKSTLMNLLIRFYDPPANSILYGGTDIRDFSLDTWRDSISYVPQDPQLFHGTLRENICYGMKEPLGDEELKPYLEKARIDELVKRAPKGLDTFVGDRGITLSGGEKQRVAIARAIIKDSPILLLDEATSSLDSRTERLIQQALSELVEGKTTFVIAHRLSTIQNAHQIVVLERGEVKESGTLDELLEKKSLFANYWEEQKFF